MTSVVIFISSLALYAGGVLQNLLGYFSFKVYALVAKIKYHSRVLHDLHNSFKCVLMQCCCFLILFIHNICLVIGKGLYAL